MKIIRIAAISVIILAALSWGFLALFHSEEVAQSLGGNIFIIGAIAVVVCLAILALGGTSGVSTLLGRLGGSSGPGRGPAPGDGSVIHHSSGEADFDGSSGDAMPPVKSSERNQPYPRDRRAD
jgi:uncharacterized membrane protein YuzA (DUF378 family)